MVTETAGRTSTNILNRFQLLLMLSSFVSYSQGSNSPSQKNMLTYYGKERGSYAIYPVWKRTANGIISFQFKTSDPNGLLLYVDDHRQPEREKRENYMKLCIENNALKLEIQVSIREGKGKTTRERSETLGNYVSDNNFHYVTIERRAHETKFSLDGKSSSVTFPKGVILSINSPVYIGGVYPTSNPRLFVDPHITFADGFVGCLYNLRYGDGQPGKPVILVKPDRTDHTDKGCRNKCYSDPTFTCMNGGRCLNKYRETACDCYGTGFRGPTCQNVSSSQLFMNGNTFISWTPGGELNSYTADIFIRFKTVEHSGIIMLIEDNGDAKEKLERLGRRAYLFLEMHGHSLYLHFKTRDISEQIVKLGDISRTRTSWRYIKISKRRTDIAVKLNDGNTGREYLRQMLDDDDELNMKGYLNISKVFVGGVDAQTKSSLDISRSQTNFTGCIQDVIVNQYDIVKLQVGRDKDITDGGGVEEGCPRLRIGDKKVFPFDKTSMETKDSNETTAIARLKPTSSFEKKARDKMKNQHEESITLIAIACGVPFVLLLICILFMRHYYRRKIRKEKKHCETYSRQQNASRVNQNAHPLRQKCIREEIDTNCDLHTFSPVRRDFYVSEFDTILRSQDTAESTLVRSRDQVQSISREKVQSSTESVPFIHDTVVNYDSVNQRVESLFKNPDKNPMNRCRKISHNSNSSSAYGRNNSNNNNNNNNHNNNNNNNLKMEHRYAQPCQQHGSNSHKRP